MKVCQMFGMAPLACSLEEATSLIIDAAANRNRCLVVTPNVDHIVTVMLRPELKNIYKETQLLFADGMPLVWLSRILPGHSLPERVTGADLLETVCAGGAKKGLSIALVGGKPGVAERAGAVLEQRYHGLRVIGTYSPPFGFENIESESQHIISLCDKWKPDILCLALGAPKQEIWAYKYLDKLQCGPVLCFGAAVDFVAGEFVRAPVFMQQLGLEWFWRVMQDPRRLFWRYFVKDSRFLWYAFRELVFSWVDYLSRNNKRNSGV